MRLRRVCHLHTEPIDRLGTWQIACVASRVESGLIPSDSRRE